MLIILVDSVALQEVMVPEQHIAVPPVSPALLGSAVKRKRYIHRIG